MQKIEEVKKAISFLAKKISSAFFWRFQHQHKRILFRIARWNRNRLINTTFVAVTGSAGKTTTKDFIARILEQHLGKGTKTHDTFNYPEDIARVLIGTRKSDAFCVAEVSAHDGPGTIDLPLSLLRPQIGVVTKVDSDHISAFGDQNGIAAEKSKLVRAVPPSGGAVLNADDPLVIAMAEHCAGRLMTFGSGVDAMLRGWNIRSSWPDRLSFSVAFNGASIPVQTQLCGTHWAPSVLAALATGVALGVPLTKAAVAVANISPFAGRMEPVVVDGITFIRDDWKAPLSTVAPAFDFMREAKARRKVIVVGTISDCPGDWSRRYAQMARTALSIADCVVFVGPSASAALRAKRDDTDALHAFPSLNDAANFLNSYLKPEDLVLLKGSARADHLQRLILARNKGVQCWRSDCHRNIFCDTCELLGVPSGTLSTIAPLPPGLSPTEEITATPLDEATTVIVGLGNPQEQLGNTPHNVGSRTVDLLANRSAQAWNGESELALLSHGMLDGEPICLVKLLCPMNEAGIALAALAKLLHFDVPQCILIHDDLDLPLGTVRSRNRGSDGGHRGVRSILQAFQSDKFRRIKIGIGRDLNGLSVADYMVTPFRPEQLAIAKEASIAAADATLELVRKQREARDLAAAKIAKGRS